MFPEGMGRGAVVCASTRGRAPRALGFGTTMSSLHEPLTQVADGSTMLLGRPSASPMSGIVTARQAKPKLASDRPLWGESGHNLGFFVPKARPP